MTRCTRHQMFMSMALAAAKRSTCYRLNVGAVLVKDHNVISIGYNGAPAGQSHCTGQGCQYFTPNGCKVNHAEANALVRAGALQHHASARGCTLYCTHSPCNDCVELILNWGHLKALYYEQEYRDRTPVERLLRDSEVPVFRLLPSGYVIDVRTGGLCEPTTEVER